MSAADEHRCVAAEFTATVEGVPDGGWDRPAPPHGWVARDVVRHLTEWFPAFLRGTAAAGGIAVINAVGNIGGFVGPYGLGYLRDATQSFTIGLVAIGVVMMAGGAVVLLVPDRSRTPRNGTAG